MLIGTRTKSRYKFQLILESKNKKDINKYLKCGCSPDCVSEWLLKEKNEKISGKYLMEYRKCYFPDVKTIRNKKIEDANNTSKKSKSKSKTITRNVQTNFTVPSENVTPEETLQKLLNIIYNNCENFKDGNVVQALSAVARLINDKDLEKIDVEDTMRRFVTNDKLKEKVQNAKYD